MSAPSKYDIESVRQAAYKRWPEILSSLAGVPLETFNGRHQPCPKCGGSDRFRSFDDDTGGAICNQCFTSANGDGFAVLRWLNGNDFPTALASVAEYLGIPPTPSNGKGGHGKGNKADPAADLTFLDADLLDCEASGPARLLALWCLTHKPGIDPSAIVAAHGRIASYASRSGTYQVIALPIFGPKLLTAKPVGWCLYNLAGGKLPRFVKGRIADWLKVKLTSGSGTGWVGNADRLADAETVWKVEGPTDALAALSLAGRPDNVAIIANANGAKETPKQWMIDSLAGKTVYVVHDADRPGQEGATWVEHSGGSGRPGWAMAIAGKARECRNVVLPFEVAASKGKDLRDWAAIQ